MSIKSFNSYNEEESKKDKRINLTGKIKESAEYKNDNYMFFANLQHIVRMASEIMEMDESEIDEMLTDGHDWANDHISKSMESIEHVYNFLLSSLDRDEQEIVEDEMEDDIEEMEDELSQIEEKNVKTFKDFE